MRGDVEGLRAMHKRDKCATKAMKKLERSLAKRRRRTPPSMCVVATRPARFAPDDLKRCEPLIFKRALKHLMAARQEINSHAKRHRFLVSETCGGRALLVAPNTHDASSTAVATMSAIARDGTAVATGPESSTCAPSMMWGLPLLRSSGCSLLFAFLWSDLDETC